MDADLSQSAQCHSGADRFDCGTAPIFVIGRGYVKGGSTELPSWEFSAGLQQQSGHAAGRPFTSAADPMSGVFRAAAPELPERRIS